MNQHSRLTFCWLCTCAALVPQKIYVSKIHGESRAHCLGHVVQGVPHGLVWPVSIEGSETLPLGAMPLFGVAPEAFSLLNNASQNMIIFLPRAQPRSKAVDSKFLPGCNYIHGVLSRTECEALINLTERIGFLDVDSGKNTQGALTALLDSEAFVNALFERCRSALPSTMSFARNSATSSGQGNAQQVAVVRSLAGLNQRCRFYRYRPNARETFRPHRDDSSPGSGFLPLYDSTDALVAGQETLESATNSVDQRFMRWDVTSGTSASLLTFLLYLNDDFGGGETAFFPEASGAASPQPEDSVACATTTKNYAPWQASLSRRATKAMAVPSRVPVHPVQGSVLVFPQTCELGNGGVGEENLFANSKSPLHEGSIVRELPGGGGRPKYVMRSDVLYYF